MEVPRSVHPQIKIDRMADPANLLAAYQNGTLTRPTVFIGLLQANPRNTLRRFPVNVADDGSIGASGRTNRCFVSNHGQGRRPGSRLGTLNMHAAEGFNFSLTSLGTPSGHQIDVQRVATVLANPALNQVAANADWCRLPNHTGPGILLTCQLTGCAFIVRLGTDGRLRCAHILPTDPTTGNAIMTGEALHDQLDQGGYLAVYGRRDYDHRTAGVYDRSVAIVGIRRPNGWKIYA